MSPPSKTDVTRLLEQWRDGDARAFEELLPLVYGELRKLAANRLRAERVGHTLQTTALVHESYLRLAGKDRARIRDRSHFFAVAAQAMRRVLIDHARRQRAAKRDAGVLLELGEGAGAVTVPSAELLALDLALERLAGLDPRQARVVELRYFGGLTVPEVAEVLEVSEATVNREWRSARLWLRRELATSEVDAEVDAAGDGEVDEDER